MKIVVLDSNALIMPFNTSINIDAELTRLLGSYELVIPRPIFGEIQILAQKKKEAKTALLYGKTKRLIETDSVGDLSVIEAAEKTNGIILTNDKELIDLAKKRKITVIRLRGGKRLAFADGREHLH